MAEGGGLLNRYRVVKPYRGFESLRLRHPASLYEIRRMDSAFRAKPDAFRSGNAEAFKRYLTSGSGHTFPYLRQQTLMASYDVNVVPIYR